MAIVVDLGTWNDSSNILLVTTVATLIIGPFQILTELSMRFQISTVASKQNATTGSPIQLIKIIGRSVPILGLETRAASSAALLFAENPRFNVRSF